MVELQVMWIGIELIRLAYIVMLLVLVRLLLGEVHVDVWGGDPPPP